MTPDDYDPQKDSHDSYFAAIAAKKERGDHLRDPLVDRRMKKLGAAIEAEIERQEAHADGRA